VNAIGTLAATQAFAPVLGANGGGGIFNIVSIALSSFPSFVSYSASKAALHSITQATRILLRARQGIKVASAGVEAPEWQGARSAHSGTM
jgi:NAD(P)-dependent dehydrogenase (short-subunit alcohol dehydrogenase family)